jgi:hypothetical protein
MSSCNEILPFQNDLLRQELKLTNSTQPSHIEKYALQNRSTLFSISSITNVPGNHVDPDYFLSRLRRLLSILRSCNGFNREGQLMREVDYLPMAEGILGMLVELIKIMNGVFETLWLSDSLGISRLGSCIW